jgi:predicted Abi (CAAX) family protease
MKLRIGSLSILAFLFLAGCGSRGSGTVSGTVSVSGTPLDAGLITFVGTEEPFATESAGIRQGRYETAEMPAGQYTVIVKVIDANAAARAKPEQDLAPGANPSKANKAKPHANYEDPALSGLSHTVSKGKSEGVFNLEPQP